MEPIKLNKISTRYYWEHLLLVRDDILKPLFFPTEVFTSEQRKSLFKKFVCIVNLETSTYCNRKCPYCPVSLADSRKKQLCMADEVFNKILGELKSMDYSSTMVFNLYNEPLADENIYLRIRQARENLPSSFLMFNSNGDYVDSDSLNKLSEIGLNAIFITLHPPIDKPYKLDDRLKDFQKFSRRIGMDTNGTEISAPSENGHIESNIDWNGMRLRIMSDNWSEYGNSRAGTIDSLNASKTRVLPCVRPLREFTISYNGNVFPCCQFFPDSAENEKYVIDNVSSNSIFEIYASHILAEWRKKLFTFGAKEIPCDSCRDEDFSKEDSSKTRETILDRLRVP